MGFLGLMIFHPNTNGLIGGLAQFGLYLAILAPVFWATKFVGSAKQLHRLLWILLICNGLNSVVGILQVHDPQRWMPKEFSRVITQGMSMSMYTYKGANGQEIIRPPGLFDTPGAVCGPGMLAGFLGIALFLNEKKLWRKLLALGLSGAGISVIYLTLVRTNLIVLAGMLTLLAILQLFGKTKTRTVSVIALTIALGLAGFFFAQQFGGKSIEERVMTLSQGSATDVFYRSRGVSVEHGFKHLLPQYPFGAGLGRWGMIANYFGRNLNDETGGFFLEIQFSGWIIDGGIVLLVLYCGAILAALWNDFQISKSVRDPELAFLASCALASNAGIAVMCFSFVPFCSQIGLQFWFLTGAVHGLACGLVTLQKVNESEGSNKPETTLRRPQFRRC